MRRGILAPLLTVSGMMALAKLIGAVKVVVIARYFGVTSELDSYLIAFLIPSFFADLAAGAISPALIPVFVAAAQKTNASVNRLVGSVAFCALAALLAVTAATLLGSSVLVSLVAPSIGPEQLDLTRSLMTILAPIIVLGGLASVWRSVLNARGEFALPAAAFSLTPLAIIAAVLVTGQSRSSHALAVGTLFGAVLESALVGWRLHRSGISPLPRWAGWDRNVEQVARQYAPLLAASLLFGAAVYVNQSVAAGLGTGGISALNYGSRVLQVLLVLGPGALGVAGLPLFSEMAASRDWTAMRGAFHRYNRAAWLVALPLTLALVALSGPVVRLLFERGEFSAADTQAVVAVQQLYLIQLPFALPAMIAARMLSSVRANHVLLGASAAYLTANAGLALAFAGPLGVAGIALANSAAMAIYFCYFAYVISRRDAGLDPMRRAAVGGVVHGDQW